MQAIHTKYHPVTDTRGARLSASCAAVKRPKMFPHPIELSGEDAHRHVAEKLAASLGWVGRNYGRLHGGGMPDGSFVWVMLDPLATQGAHTLRGLAQRVQAREPSTSPIPSAEAVVHMALLMRPHVRRETGG